MKLKMLNSKIIMALAASLLLSACNSSNSALESKETAKATVAEGEQAAAETAEATKEEAKKEANQEFAAANIIKKPSTVSKRGGHIPIIVNNQPITNFDIQRRVQFMKLRRSKNAGRKGAENELIEQTLKLQEAQRRRLLVPDRQVNLAFDNFARSNRATPALMTRELNKRGVGADHFKQFIRTQMSWQRTVQGKFRAETTRKSERDVVTQLRKTGSEKPEVTEYNLKQVIFVVPEGKRSDSKLRARRSEANAFRQQFTGCESAVQLAKSLRDVSILDRNRIMEPELPDQWKDEIPSVGENQITRPVQTGRGIELMAVCQKRQVNDDRAAQITEQASDFESFNEKGDEFSQNYLKELKERATIIYR